MKVGVIPGVMPVHLSSLVLTVRRRAIGSIIWAADVGGPGDRFAAGPWKGGVKGAGRSVATAG